MYESKPGLVRRLLGFKKLYLAVITALIGASFIMTSLAGATNISIGGPSDCDDNAVIHCGAHSANELMNDYRNSAYVRAVYSYSAFGISNADMNNLPTTVVEGSVTKQGDVFAGGQLVASNAMTGGRQDRQDMPGSTKVNVNGAIFFKRSPSVSFLSSSLPAYVSMANGRFQFAVIASCGNPVGATPIVQKTAVAPARPVNKPQPQKPSKPTPPPAPPAPTQTQSQSQTQQVNQNQQVTVENQPIQSAAAAPAEQPAQTQVAASTTAPAAQTLPNTGPGSALGFFTASSLIGYLSYRRFLLRKLG